MARSKQQRDIFGGLTPNQLADLFGMRRLTVERRIGGINPCGRNNLGTPLYQVRDVAPRLIPIKLTDEQVRETLQKGDPKDFPAMTNKIFWEGLIQRRKYEEQVGDLWHTSDVVGIASAAFNAIRMALLLLPDNLSDDAGLNEQQRGIVQRIIDTSLESLRDALVDELQKPSRSRPEPSAEDGEI